MFTEYKSGALPSNVSGFTTGTHDNANVLKHMELLHALFDLSLGEFIETVQLTYQDNAIYCFMSCYVFAHVTQNHVM